MTTYRIETQRSPELCRQLTAVWRASVVATHSFLSPAEIDELAPVLPAALAGVEHLLVAYQDDQPVGFLGVADQRLEMLFLDPTVRGQGMGGQMLRQAIQQWHVTALTVNQQNPQAVAFYQHLGFEVVRQTATDEQGRPYPLLYMQLPRT